MPLLDVSDVVLGSDLLTLGRLTTHSRCRCRLPIG
jgi:hypothetical protein